MKRFSRIFFAAVFVLSFSAASFVLAQGAEKKAAPAPKAAQAANAGETGVKPAMAKYREAQAALKSALREAAELQRQYLGIKTTDEEKEEIGEKLEKISKVVSKIHPKLFDLAEKAWLEEPSREDGEFLNFIIQVLETRMTVGEYERADAIMQGLIALKIPEILPDLYDAAGEIAFMLNNFEQAARYFDLAEQNKVLSERCAGFKKDLSYYRSSWAKESLLRQQDAGKKDLPRVTLDTTKGKIVLELYEDQAPNTVANFVYLAEKGYYDGMFFEQVIPGEGAVAGRSLETPEGDPGWTIRDEFDPTTSRNHYRGTISMLRGEPNSAGSTFFISFSPIKDLDGKYVVFGRVVEGMDVLTKLQIMDPANPDPMAEPDQIEKASAVTKRDHKYRPKILKKVNPEEERAKAEAEKAQAEKKASKNKKNKKPAARTAY
ncbi:MAG: peptidylprolyl isomerase [Thermoguttaceae bacterium]|nr:peptidylprolyl isomerase [Thermoguttaceae bacterium]